MAKNDFAANFHDAFRSMLEVPEIAAGTGSLRFIRPDKKTVGTIALRSGKVEALEITRHPNYLLYRAANTAELSGENRDQLLTKFRNTPDSPLVADYLRQYMMLSDQLVTGYVKEHFLGVLDELMTWSAVRPEWRAGAEDRVLTMPFVSPDKLLALGVRRAEFLVKIADEYTIETTQLDDLKFRQINEVITEDPDTLNILRLGSGEYGATGVYRQTGIVPFNVHRELHELWLDKIVDLIYAGQFPLARPAELAQDTIAAEATAVAAEVEVAPELEPEVAEAHIMLAEEADSPAVIDEGPAMDEQGAADATVDEDEIQPAATDETPEATEQVFSAPTAAGEELPLTAAVEDVSPQPFISPFDDDYEVSLAQDTPTVGITPAVDDDTVVTAEPAIVPIVADGPVATGAAEFLQSINQMKQAAQQAWEEVVARDEEMTKTRAELAQQQEYLTQLENERAAWNTDFEAKRASYEATVALLREHLQ